MHHLLTPHPQSIGDDDDSAAETSSSTTLEVDGEYAPVFFDPRPLRNLVAIDAMPSMCPILDLKVRGVKTKAHCNRWSSID